MIQINLLPWREQARKAQKTRLAFMAGGCVVFAILTVAAFHLHFRGKISNQEQRNNAILAHLEKENAALVSLRKQQEEVTIIERQLQFIYSLRDSSYQAVKILDELVKVSPENINLDRIMRKGSVITIAGKANSNLQVTLFMDNLQQSKFFNQPVLTRISGKDGEVGRERSFQLRVELQGK